MPALTRKEVEEIALLARLHLESDELDRMQTELGAIIDYFSTIAVVPTEGVAPMTHAVPTTMTLRPDDVVASLPVEDALRGTARRDGDLIVVPAIISGAE